MSYLVRKSLGEATNVEKDWKPLIKLTKELTTHSRHLQNAWDDGDIKESFQATIAIEKASKALSKFMGAWHKEMQKERGSKVSMSKHWGVRTAI